jgi:hypothetical protein
MQKSVVDETLEVGMGATTRFVGDGGPYASAGISK